MPADGWRRCGRAGGAWAGASQVSLRPRANKGNCSTPKKEILNMNGATDSRIKVSLVAVSTLGGRKRGGGRERGWRERGGGGGSRGGGRR